MLQQGLGRDILSFVEPPLIPSQDALERAVNVVCHLFGVPIVFIGGEEEAFTRGLDAPQRATFWSFVRAVSSNDLVVGDTHVVLDAARDERTAGHAAVRELGLRFYAGTFLSGQHFCVAHREPREHFGEAERAALLDAATLNLERHALHTTTRALHDTREFNQRMLESLQDCIKVLSLDSTLLYMSPNGQKALELDHIEDFLGRSWLELWHGADTEDARRALQIAREGKTGRFQESLATVTGEPKFWDVQATPMLNAQGEPEKLLLVSRDITQQKRREDELESVREQLELANMKLEHDTLHDMLTGLPNRKLFAEHVWTAISRLERHPGQRYAVLFLDFDDFKRVNDTFGHGVGDELLVAIAERLKHVVRPSDIVARLAGDEFTVLLNDVQGEHDAAQAAERVTQAFAEPLELSDQSPRVTVSIGIVLSEPHYRQPEEILRDANTAMYHAKVAGKAGYAVFRPSSP